MEWRALDQILDYMIVHVGAPVRRYRKFRQDERETFKSPKKVEAKFAKKFGKTIPDDYFEKFQSLCDDMIKFVKTCHQDSDVWKTQLQFKYFTTDIIHLRLRCSRTNVQIYYVVVRPCAEQCGFWKRVLHSIRTEIQEYSDLKSFVIQQPLTNNMKILEKMGFTATQEKDMMIDGKDLKQLPSWEVTAAPPTAAQLNDPVFVNRDLKVEHDQSSGPEEESSDAESENEF
jgi:hypothetical protein